MLPARGQSGRIRLSYHWHAGLEAQILGKVLTDPGSIPCALTRAKIALMPAWISIHALRTNAAAVKILEVVSVTIIGALSGAATSNEERF